MPEADFQIAKRGASEFGSALESMGGSPLKPTVAGRVEKWLRQSAGKCFCDACIAANVGIDSGPVSSFTKRMGAKSYSSKYRGRCDLCRGVKLVTMINGNAF